MRIVISSVLSDDNGKPAASQVTTYENLDTRGVLAIEAELVKLNNGLAQLGVAGASAKAES